MKRSLLVVMCLVFALFVAGPASATTLDLTYLIGTVVPASPASPSDELVYVNNLINFYNGDITNPSNASYTYTLDVGSKVPAPDIALATGGVQSSGAPTFPVDVTGFTYLWAKFGDQGALYWLDSITSVDGFSPTTGPFAAQGSGLSHITLFGPGTPPPPSVPEAGALIMFGSGLIGLVGYRRVRRMQ